MGRRGSLGRGRLFGNGWGGGGGGQVKGPGSVRNRVKHFFFFFLGGGGSFYLKFSGGSL